MVTIRKGDKDKTAFVTFFGLYPFLRMSFGMRNFLTTLQQLIDRFKAGLPDVYIAYMYERFHPVVGDICSTSERFTTSFRQT